MLPGRRTTGGWESRAWWICYASRVKTQDELRAEFRQLLAEDRLEEASVVLDDIEPPPFEAIKKMLEEAPIDDEPLSARDIRRLQAAEERRRQRAIGQPTG